MAQIVKWIQHNQGLFVALLICGVLLVWTLGCESRVTSLKQPDKSVTRDELVLEVEELSKKLEQELILLQQQAELKFARLDRDERIQRQLLEFAAVAAQGGGVNPAGLGGLLIGILGFGAIVDNRIKDKVIKNRPVAKSSSA